MEKTDYLQIHEKRKHWRLKVILIVELSAKTPFFFPPIELAEEDNKFCEISTKLSHSIISYKGSEMERQQYPEDKLGLTFKEQTVHGKIVIEKKKKMILFKTNLINIKRLKRNNNFCYHGWSKVAAANQTDQAKKQYSEETFLGWWGWRRKRVKEKRKNWFKHPKRKVNK